MQPLYPCRNISAAPVTRREALSRTANGFGALALAALAHESSTSTASAAQSRPLSPKSGHHPAKAKSVIFLYMDGGPSQVDTFDPKPRLRKENGKPFGMKMEPTQFNNNGATLGHLWDFHQYGQSGMPISDLFPRIAQHADDLAVVRSMVSNFSEHTNGNYFLHTGLGIAGRPSMGAWVSYGLGTENQNLPAFVVINGGLIPPGGLPNFSSGFLPATHQASIFRPNDPPVANIRPTESKKDLQRNKLSLLKKLDQKAASSIAQNDAIESAIQNYELAFRMQSAVPELMNLQGETEATREMYGLNAQFDKTQTFGSECLMARRLVERGVRFIELTCPNVGADRWDQHGNLKQGHERNALAVDQPISALITDLKARGLFDSTLLVWAGEFGRTPFAQGTNGRDHNPFGFSIWMAGAGIRGGAIHGATDDYGYKVVQDRVEIHDLHATMLHLLGIDHERLTVRFSGRDMRLTDVHGHVVREILT